MHRFLEGASYADVAVICQDPAAAIAERGADVVADLLCSGECLLRHCDLAAKADEHLVNDGREGPAEEREGRDEWRVGVDDGLHVRPFTIDDEMHRQLI